VSSKKRANKGSEMNFNLPVSGCRNSLDHTFTADSAQSWNAARLLLQPGFNDIWECVQAREQGTGFINGHCAVTVYSKKPRKT
jgi:hypothetical protein